MIELSFEYMNKLANQIIVISTLLAGFTFTVLVLLIDNKSSDKVIANIFRVATIATSSFIVSIMAMCNVLMKTTKGYPIPVKSEDFVFTRSIGMLTFILGIISVILIISLMGWTKSKRMGWFTTIVGIISLVFIFIALST